MVTSAKQLTANKINAKKGGIRTTKGKSISKLNAIKHGLLTREVLLASEDNELLAKLEIELLAELQPGGELERFLVDRIVSSIWRLKRAIAAEKANMDYEQKWYEENYSAYIKMDKERIGLRYTLSSNHTGKIMRYEITIERQLYRAMNALMELRTLRTRYKEIGITSN